MAYGNGYGQGGNSNGSNGSSGYGGQGGQAGYGGGGGYGAPQQNGGNGQGGGHGGAQGGNAGGNEGAPRADWGWDKDRPYASRSENVGNFALNFTEFKGVPLKDLADNDRALLLFDWLSSKPDFKGLAAKMLAIFLHRPEVAARLDAAIAAKRANYRNQQNG